MIKELLDTLCANIVSDWTQDINEKGFNASGETSSEFEFRTTEDSAEIIGLRSFLTIVQERFDGGKGSKPATGGMIPSNVILDWMKSKGIQPNEGQTQEQAAFGIARFIGEHGNAVFRGKKQGVDMIGIINRNFELFAREFAEAYIENLQKRLDLAFDE